MRLSLYGIFFYQAGRGMHFETKLSNRYEVNLGKLQFNISVPKGKWTEARFSIFLLMFVSWLTSKLRPATHISLFMCPKSYNYYPLVNYIYMFYMHDSVLTTCNILEVQFTCNHFRVNPLKSQFGSSFNVSEGHFTMYYLFK